MYTVGKCDYIKCTSWDIENEKIFRQLLRSADEVEKTMGKVSMYNGVKFKHGFVGTAMQLNVQSKRREYHVMAIASGSVAHTIATNVREWGMNCTRLDLQVTLPGDCTIDYEELHNQLQMVGINTTLYSSRTATVYIGSRTSETFIRIYQHNNGDGTYSDRFEVEYKKQKATMALQELHKLDSFLLAEVLKVSKKGDTIAELLKPFADALSGIQPIQIQRIRKVPSKDVQEYYERVVRPFLWRIMLTGEQREVVTDDILMLVYQSKMFTEDQVARGKQLSDEIKIPPLAALKTFYVEEEDVIPF